MSWTSRILAAALCFLAWAATPSAASDQSSHPIKVAAVDFVPAWGDLDGNIARLAEAVEKTAKEGVNYAVFPETAVSGYLRTLVHFFPEAGYIRPRNGSNSWATGLGPTVQTLMQYPSLAPAGSWLRTAYRTTRGTC